MEDRILVFAFNNDSRISPDSNLRGYYDGQNFVPRDSGYCKSYEELYQYEYIQLFGHIGYKSHIPREYFGNLLEKMQYAFVEEFGSNEQISFFD
jgi:hypothetical protein